MSDWLELVKIVVPPIGAGVAGYWLHYTKTKQREQDREDRERERQDREAQRQAEYEDFKRRRNLTGGKDSERADLIEKYAAVYAALAKEGGQPEKMLHFLEMATGKRPLPEITGEERAGEPIRRTPAERREVYGTLADVMIYHLAKLQLAAGASRLGRLTGEEMQQRRQWIADYEGKYGVQTLRDPDRPFESGMLSGKLIALAWMVSENSFDLVTAPPIEPRTQQARQGPSEGPRGPQGQGAD